MKVLELLSLLESSRNFNCEPTGSQNFADFLLHAAELAEIGPDRPAESAGWILESLISGFAISWRKV